MELVTIAKPYANALFEIAQQDKTHAQWKAILEAASQVLSDTQMQGFIASPKVSQKDKSSAIQNLVSSAMGQKLNEKEHSFLDLLLENDRANAVPGILSIFEDSLNAFDDAKAFTITSAYKLNAKEEKQLISDLSDQYQASVSIDVTIDENLVGGLIIKQGDKVIDLSIKARSDELGLRLLN